MNETSWHDVILRDADLTLRPIEESDWAFIYRWCNDPEVLYYSDGPGVEGYDLDGIKNDIFQAGSTNRFCFMMVAGKQIIGECWLQRMNLTRLLERYPDVDMRRIDLSIGEKVYWGRGYGTRAIALLTEFGFDIEQADMIFGCNIADYNPRSLKAFLRNGYSMHGSVPKPEYGENYDVRLTREDYLQSQ